jgi:hypothetical protein
MNKFYSFLLALFLLANAAQAQDSYLASVNGFVTTDILVNYDMLSTFDICDGVFYGHTGDTIIALDMATGNELTRYGKPADYPSYPGFVYANPSQNEIWAGFTVSGNSDDRIYRIDTETGVWHQKATLTGNFDMEIFNGHLIVDGAIYGEENVFYLLDTTGSNNHRPIIQAVGSSAGFSMDETGNLYYATSTFDENSLVKWNAEDVMAVIDNEDSEPLQMTDAEKLSDLHAGAYDCDIDDAGNIVFNMNDYASDKVMAIWNTASGDGFNFDTLAYTSDDMDWLTMIKTTGNVRNTGDANGACVLSYARPVAKVQGTNHAPELIQPFATTQESAGANDISLDLTEYFTDADNDELSFTVQSVSNSNVLEATISGNMMTVSLLDAGQATITVAANDGVAEIFTTLIVGLHHEITDDYRVANLEDLSLADENYWNGSEGEGYFQTENVIFANEYNTEYGSWSQWAYSNVTDNTTPGWANQYSAITGAGFEADEPGSGTYAVGYASAYAPPMVKFADDKAHTVKGFYVANSTYAALAMMHGDSYSKKFGGETGNDPDWLKLSVWGLHNGANTDTVEFYLADYRFDDNVQDYILQTWQWVELSELGYVDSLQMMLNSSDVGEWGMNTPAYFCADNFYIGDAENSIEAFADDVDFQVYPNPATDHISINFQEYSRGKVTIIDVSGKVVMQTKFATINQKIDINSLSPGLYMIQVQTGSQIKTKRIIKQ